MEMLAHLDTGDNDNPYHVQINTWKDIYIRRKGRYLTHDFRIVDGQLIRTEAVQPHCVVTDPEIRNRKGLALLLMHNPVTGSNLVLNGPRGRFSTASFPFCACWDLECQASLSSHD
jgi:hypothetical protein